MKLPLVQAHSAASGASGFSPIAARSQVVEGAGAGEMLRIVIASFPEYPYSRQIGAHLVIETFLEVVIFIFGAAERIEKTELHDIHGEPP